MLSVQKERMGHLLSSLLCIAMLFLSCRGDSGKDQLAADNRDGNGVARKFCGTCHDFVDPVLLPKEYWKTVLLRMSPYMGFDRKGDPFYGNTRTAVSRLDSAHVFPENQLISDEQWQQLVKFYLENAPDSLDQGIRVPSSEHTTQFKVHTIPWRTSLNGPSYVMTLDDGKILVGYNLQNNRNQLNIISTNGELIQTLGLPSALSDVAWEGNKIYMTCMGPFEADDTPYGTVLSAIFDPESATILDLKPLLIGRQRPVNISMIDVKEEGGNSFLVAEFGKFLGGLYRYNMTQDGSMESTSLYDYPGALMTIVRDVNGDGLSDFYALFGQGSEGIALYINTGDGTFDRRQILSFPPYYGSVHFQLIDFDQDGLEDIIYNNGDSGDFGTPPKPFHGIRLFKNTGDAGFVEEWFIPQQGSYKTTVVDFDEDGDLDMASIGFFARSAGMPEETFLYFQNVGKGEGHPFDTYTIPFEGDPTFLCMDHGDLDGDGDMDLVLGSSTLLMDVSSKVQKASEWERNGGAVIWIENMMR